MTAIPQPREYQRRLILDANDRFQSGYRSVLAQLQTGGGKTICAGLITRTLVRKYGGKRKIICLYLVHRQELVEQVRDTLESFGMGDMVGVIQGQSAIKPWAPLQIATVQTIVNRIEKYAHWLHPMLLVVDEAHHMRAATWEKVVDHYTSKGSRMLGLTATPARTDGKGLYTHFETMVEGPTTGQLMEAGALCAVKCYSPVVMHADFSKIKSDKDRKSRSTPKFRADIIDFYSQHCQNRRVIHFANSVEDSIDCVKRWEALGVRAGHIDGKTNHWERKQILKEFASGEIEVLSNYEIVTEGFDVPACDAVIISRKTSSTVLFRQMIGRGRRPKQDDGYAVIGDLVDNLAHHEHPDVDPEWSLEDGVVAIKRKEGEKKTRKTCEECGVIYAAKYSRCPDCGGVKEKKSIEDVKIEMAERKAEENKLRQNRRKKMNQEVFWSRGDETKLEEIQQRYQMSKHIIKHWNRIYKNHWEKLRERDDAIDEMYEQVQMQI